MSAVMQSDFSAGVPLMVAPALIVPSPNNPRKKKGLDIASLTSLAADIRRRGIMQPPLVRTLPPERVEETADMQPRPAYEIIVGERRTRAAQLADLERMPALLRDDLSEEEIDEMRLVENIQREDLDPFEEAEGFEQLRKKHGYSIKQIAAKITDNKGESYVYKRMALNKVVPAVRDAYYEENGPDLSLMLLIAGYEADEQEQVLGYIEGMKARADNRWPTFRVAQDAVGKAFNFALANAPFDITSVDLVPAAGACTDCPKRTVAQAEMFGETSSVDECTDGTCFATKRSAHVVVLRARLAKEGFKVIDGEDAKRAVEGVPAGVIKGYQRLDRVAYMERGDDNREREVTFGDALRSMGKKAPKPRMFIDPHSLEPLQVITSELADKLVPAEKNAEAKPPKSAKKVAAQKAAAEDDPRSPEEVALDVPDVQRAVLLRVFDAVRNGVRTDAEAKIVAKVLLVEQEGWEMTADYLGLDVGADRDQQTAWIDAMVTEQLGQLLTMASIEISFGDFAGSALHATKRLALVKSYGVDVIAVRDKVAADLERVDAAVDDKGELHPGLLEPLIEKAIEAVKAAEIAKGKKKVTFSKLTAMRNEMNALRDAQADLRAGNTDEAMAELRELAGLGEFEGQGWAQIVGDGLRQLLTPAAA